MTKHKPFQPPSGNKGVPPDSPTPSRQQIRRATAEYLARGGQIKRETAETTPGPATARPTHRSAMVADIAREKGIHVE